MNKYVADTMAIVLYIENRKLPVIVKRIFSEALEGKSIIYFSAVSLMEIGYLYEKSRIDTSISSVIKLTEKHKNFMIYSLDSATVTEAFKIKTIPELHDRLITASAATISAALITNDPVIHKSQYVKIIW
jgi:PIN domain nuclease of toxin-antitoxin system